MIYTTDLSPQEHRPPCKICKRAQEPCCGYPGVPCFRCKARKTGCSLYQGNRGKRRKLDASSHIMVTSPTKEKDVPTVAINRGMKRKQAETKARPLREKCMVGGMTGDWMMQYHGRDKKWLKMRLRKNIQDKVNAADCTDNALAGYLQASRRLAHLELQEDALMTALGNNL